MQELKVSLHSFDQVREFVKISSLQTFPVAVGNDLPVIDGTDLMGMFSLDYTQPLIVKPECDEYDFSNFRRKLKKFLA